MQESSTSLNSVELDDDRSAPRWMLSPTPSLAFQHMMQGAVIKTFFSEVVERPEEDLVVTSVMPCVRKQGEADRALESTKTEAGHRHVDHVVTTKVRIDLDLIERSRSRFFPCPHPHPLPHTHALSLSPSLPPSGPRGNDQIRGHRL